MRFRRPVRRRGKRRSEEEALREVKRRREDSDVEVDAAEEAETDDDSDDYGGGGSSGGEEDVEVNGYAVNEVEVKVKPLVMTEADMAAGRKDEVDFMLQLPVFEFVKVEEAWERTGKAPTTTRWLGNWKMMEDCTWKVRSRLVGRDFKPHGEDGREDLFAAMPPLEAKKLLFVWRWLADVSDRGKTGWRQSSCSLMFGRPI